MSEWLSVFIRTILPTCQHMYQYTEKYHCFLCVCVPADTEDVCIVERLFSSSLVAIVSLKAPRKLKVCHFKKGTEICNYSYSNTILAVKLNRQVKKSLSTKKLFFFFCSEWKWFWLPLAVTLIYLMFCCLETDSVSGGIPLHTQHPRHESATHDPRNSS